jgi:hypothetical protein
LGQNRKMIHLDEFYQEYIVKNFLSALLLCKNGSKVDLM